MDHAGSNPVRRSEYICWWQERWQDMWYAIFNWAYWKAAPKTIEAKGNWFASKLARLALYLAEG